MARETSDDSGPARPKKKRLKRRLKKWLKQTLEISPPPWQVSSLEDILALLLPALIKVETLVLQYPVRFNTGFLEWTIRSAARRERPFDIQPPFQALKVFVFPSNMPDELSTGLAAALEMIRSRELGMTFIATNGNSGPARPKKKRLKKRLKQTLEVSHLCHQSACFNPRSRRLLGKTLLWKTNGNGSTGQTQEAAKVTPGGCYQPACFNPRSHHSHGKSLLEDPLCNSGAAFRKRVAGLCRLDSVE
ncbi:hypothetical protein MMC07_004419 [Pseudocyphellaria aurata]|nr:hypothetical protein [Pseudocyphellaria aurata]